MRSLWKRFIQNIFGKPDSLQGDWMGQGCDLSCEDWCECDSFEE